MKQTAKRFFALLLALSMCLSLAAPAWTAEVDPADTEAAESSAAEEESAAAEPTEETPAEAPAEEDTSVEEPAKQEPAGEVPETGPADTSEVLEAAEDGSVSGSEGESTTVTASGTCGDNLTWTLEDGTLTISGTGKMEDYTSPSDAPWYSSQCSIATVVTEDGVTSIGDSAFGHCYLTSVTIPDSVTSIRGCAFYGCNNLTNVTIPASVTSVTLHDFSWEFTRLSAIYVDSDNPVYSSLDGVLFNKDQTELVLCPPRKTGSYTIPDSVSTIGEYAFNQSHLSSITMPDSVTSIGDYAFYCSDYFGFKSITIGSGVKTIGDYAFCGRERLTSVTIPDSVTSIGDWAFYDCALTSITIPTGVTSIGAYAFASNNSLTTITLLSKNITLGEYCFGYDIDVDSLTSSSDDLSAASEEELAAASTDVTKVEGFYLVGYSGSTAQTYAKNNGFTFKAFGTPTLFCVSNAAKGITVSWKQVAGATGCKVYRKAGSATGWSCVKTISKNSTVSWTDTDVKNYTKYTYTVKACTKNGSKTVWSGYNKTGKTV